MGDKKTPFDPGAIQDAELSKQMRDADIKDKAVRALETGRKCLTNPDFIKYQEEYEALEKSVVEAWILTDIMDPVKYTVYTHGLALQLRQMRLLLELVKKDANKKDVS